MTQVSKALSFTVTFLMTGMTACSAADDGPGSASQAASGADIAGQASDDLRIDVEAVDAGHARFSAPASGAEELSALLQSLASTEISISRDHEIATALVPSSWFRAPTDPEATDSTGPGVQTLGLFSKKWFMAEYTTLAGDSGCEDNKFFNKVQAVYFWSHLFPIMQHVTISQGQCP